MKEIILTSLEPQNIGWLFSQIIKYITIPISIRFLNGKTLSGPLMGGIFVTYRCNSNCTMCHYPSRSPQKEMDTEELANVIKEMANIGVSGIGLTGGEPLLRDDIFYLVKYAKSFHLPVTLNTNGILLGRKDILEKVIDCAPTNINISLDSATSSKHDHLRGGIGLFDKTIAGIKSLADAIKSSNSKTRITVVTVISDDNYDEIEEIAELAKAIGAHRLGIIPLHHYEKDRCVVVQSDRTIDFSERLKKITAIPIESSTKYINSLDLAFAGKPFPLTCNAGYTSIFVDPYGKVSPCLGYVQKEKWLFEHNKDQNLAKLWSSVEYADLRKETLRCHDCYLNCQAELNFLWPPHLY